jgi:formylglycine-generating enzyme required for sulfatase activity
MPHTQFHLFFSYNSADRPEVLKLATKLKDFGLNPWLDAWHLVAGEPWLPAIESALRDCGACAVVVGPHGLGNVQEDEMWRALERSIDSKRGDRRFRVIPILLPNCARGDRARLPKFLTANTWIEFQRTLDEPAALHKLRTAIRGEPPGTSVQFPSAKCPYRGLAYFDIQHAPLFFGREALTDWLLSRLRGTASKDGATRFLAIVGASGSGKSSLARAGLLAKLKSGELAGSANWPQVICRPQTRPLESLATALANAEGVNLGTGLKADLIEQLEGSLLDSPERLHLVAQGAMPSNDSDWRLVVLVDQFEELFTLNQPDARNAQAMSHTPALSSDRVAFFRNLLRAATIENGRTIVIMTMRADFYGKCAAFPELATAVSQHQELVGAMSADELRSAVETPAQLSGIDIEPGLVDLLVREVTDQPGALPLLQYALAELWQKSRELRFNKLTTSAYRELGGWDGALSQCADAVLAQFKNTPQENLCRQLFLRLVQPGEGTEDTKRLVRWRELERANAGEAAALEQTVRKLADNRLITTSGDELEADSTIEVVHEALIRSWPELRKWLDADRAGLLIHRRLTEATKEWAKSHNDVSRRDRTLFYAGTRLATAQEWAEKNGAALNDLERQFLAESIRSLADREDGLRADKLVSTLLKSEIGQVPGIVRDIESCRRFADPELKRLTSTANSKPEQRLRASLALAPVDPTQVGYLSERLLDCSVEEFAVVRDYLRPHRATMEADLWDRLRNTEQPEGPRFKAGMALAAFAADAETWTKTDADFLVAQLLGSNPDYQRELRSYLKPISDQLLEPLEVRFRDATARDTVREAAANALAEFAANDPDRLARLASEATPEQWRIIFTRLIAAQSEQPGAAEKTLLVTIQNQPGANVPETQRVQLGQRRAGAAITLLRMGQRETTFDVFRVGEDPESLTQFVHRAKDRGVGPAELLDCLDRATEERVRFGLLLALGEYSLADIAESRRKVVTRKLLDWYRSDPSSAIHGACGWVLRLPGWGLKEQVLQVDHTPLPCDGKGQREWFVEKIGQDCMTFVILPPGEFLMGSPDEPSHVERSRSSDEILHWVQLTRPIAMLDRAVTRGQFGRFVRATNAATVNVEEWSPSDEHPVVGEMWYQAVSFCRWLTEEAGMTETDQCYDNPKKLPKGPEGFPENWPFHPERRGYRLPTEAEWEYACRGGTRSAYGFGSDRSLSRHYGWFVANEGKRTHVGGELRPNLRGLVDMHGNVFEWCHDWYGDYAPADASDPSGPKAKGQSRVLRGGGWVSRSRLCRSADRCDVLRPTYRYSLYGFRVVCSVGARLCE